MPHNFKTPNNPQKAKYFNDGNTRRDSIKDWLEESIQDENKQFVKFNIDFALRNGNIKEAFELFVNLIEGLENEELKYILKHNRQDFGDKVYFDMLKRWTGSKKQINANTIKKNKDPSTIEEIIEKTKDTESIGKGFFGIRKDGSKVLANVSVFMVKGIERVRLRDKDTGRFLKHTVSFNEEVQRRIKEE